MDLDRFTTNKKTANTQDFHRQFGTGPVTWTMRKMLKFLPPDGKGPEDERVAVYFEQYFFAVVLNGDRLRIARELWGEEDGWEAPNWIGKRCNVSLVPNTGGQTRYMFQFSAPSQDAAPQPQGRQWHPGNEGGK